MPPGTTRLRSDWKPGERLSAQWLNDVATLLANIAPADDSIIVRYELNQITIQVNPNNSSNTDELVAGSSTDTEPGYLDEKVQNSIEVASNKLQLASDLTAATLGARDEPSVYAYDPVGGDWVWLETTMVENVISLDYDEDVGAITATVQEQWVIQTGDESTDSVIDDPDGGLGTFGGYAAQFTAANAEYLSRTKIMPAYIAAWVYLDSTGANRAIATVYAASGNNRAYWFVYESAGVFRLDVYPSGGNGSAAIVTTQTSSLTITSGGWYFVEAVMDGSEVSVDVNRGSEPNDDSSYGGAGQTTTPYGASSAPLRIGADDSGGSTNKMNGRIDKLTMYSSVPSSTVRDALYGGGSGIPYADLTSDQKSGMISWWDLDELSGSRSDAHGSNDLADNATVTRAAGVGP